MTESSQSCTLMEKYIRLIQQGRKSVEARVAIPMFCAWKEGDTVRFFSRRDPHIYVTIRIAAKRHYKTFRDMLQTEGVDKLIPGVNSIDEGERLYLEIPKYAERERQYGVLAFRLELV